MESSHYKPFEITQQGMFLRQKAIAGEKGGKHYIIKFTRCIIGQGRPEQNQDLYLMTNVVNPAADMFVKESFAEELNHIIIAVIDNINLTQDVVMTEIGIMATLLNEDKSEAIPEILYGYTYTDKYDYVPAPVNYKLYREMVFNTFLSRSDNFTVEIDMSKLYVTLQDLADHNNNLNAHNGYFKMHPIVDISHFLNTYPNVLVIEFNYGFGMGGFGENLFSGTNGLKRRSTVEYLDRERIQISVDKRYGTVETIIGINQKEYVITFVDSTLSLYVMLSTCGEITNTGIEYKLKGYGN